MAEYNSGSISEWNEGTFKNIRLHEAQEMINVGKVNPFEISIDGTNINYNLWFNGINILYGEGHAKYGDKEIDEVENIKTMIETVLEVFPPFRTEYITTREGDEQNKVPIKNNQLKIKKMLELFETTVKYYNDKHGLSTRNMNEHDWDEI